MPRKVAAVLLGLASIVCLFAGKQKKTSDPIFGQIDGIVRSLSDITGFAEDHPVPYGRMSKRELRRFLNKRIKKTLRPDEIYADELSLKMFGLVPQDFDLKKSTIDLLTEQAAAFYDYDAKKLFLLEDPSSPAETTTLAHELSHALADQHFDLNQFMDEAPANDDENLAHTAVVEGQASWLMIAYELKQDGQPPAPTRDMLKSVADSSDTSMGDYPVLKGSPLYIQQSLLFPYAEGTLFFDTVYRKVGKAAFSLVFKEPPVASAQVIHPDRYFKHEKPTKPDIPKVGLRGDQKDLSEGAMGEFDHEILIRQYLGAEKSAAISPHLRGAQYRIVATGKDHRPLLEYASQWDSEKEAAAYFAAYEKILHAKWKHCEVRTRTTTVLAGVGDDGYFVLRLAGDTVSSVEGLRELAGVEHELQVHAAPPGGGP